ncbi:MAG: hypothetical protein R3F20_02885 [Planctomycetota bacterium]
MSSRLLAPALIVVAALALALVPGPRSAAMGAPHDAGKDIDRAMKTIEESLEKLTEIVGEKDKVKESLEEVLKLEKAFMDCKIAEPHKAEKLEGKDKEKLLREYREMNIEALKVVLDLEIAVINGKLPKAKKLVNTIKAYEGKGHGKFREKG